MVTVVLEINKSSFSAPGGSSKDSVGGEAGVPVVRLETRSTSMTAGLFFCFHLRNVYICQCGCPCVACTVKHVNRNDIRLKWCRG